MATVVGGRVRVGDHRFYVGMAGVFVLIAFGGFVPTYWARMAAGTFTAPPVIHLHGAIFFAWTLFFFFQTSLVAGGRTFDHRQWGMAGIAIATAMVFTVPMAVLASITAADAAGFGDAARRFAAVSLTSLPLFVGFVALAIARNRVPDVHKRLMILAMIPPMHAAMARLFQTAFAPPGALGPPPPFVSIPPGLTADLLIVVAIVHDWRTRGRPHPVYLVGLPVIVAQQLLVVPIAASAAWLDVVHGLEAFAG